MTPALYEAWLDHLNAVFAEPPRFTNAVWKAIGQAERDGELVTLWRRLRIVRFQRKTAPGWTPKAA